VITLKITVIALIYIVLLIIMGSALVSIMSDDVSFTDEQKFTWDRVAFGRVAVKGVIFFAAFIGYFLMIYNFKFLGD